MSHTINKEVNVLSFYFSRGETSRCFPRRIEVDGRQLDFLESGLRCLVQKGQSMVQVFNMTDGRNQYHLKFEPQQNLWTLLTMRPMQEAQ
jgi:hypothetical protein